MDATQTNSFIISGCFERFVFSPRVAPFLRYYKDFLDAIFEERVVEEEHCFLRDCQGANHNHLSSKTNRQSRNINSGVLEKRGIPHCTITHEEYVGGAQNPKGELVQMMTARRHKLPKRWSKLSGAKTWRARCPLTMRVAL